MTHRAQVVFTSEGASNQTWQSELTASNCNSILLTHPLVIMSSASCVRTLFGARLNLGEMRFIVRYSLLLKITLKKVDRVIQTDHRKQCGTCHLLF